MGIMRKLIDNDKRFFALWAEDINRYLHTAYNTQSLSEVYEALQGYISVDQVDSIDNDSLSLYEIIGMTGLTLDVSEHPFEYLDSLEEEASTFRSGNPVNKCYLI